MTDDALKVFRFAMSRASLLNQGLLLQRLRADDERLISGLFFEGEFFGSCRCPLSLLAVGDSAVTQRIVAESQFQVVEMDDFYEGVNTKPFWNWYDIGKIHEKNAQLVIYMEAAIVALGDR